ncbi:MAG: DUF547 domain-containing protein [Deltaproteobacteria bacterium]|nr:DUF547 domain-containing protein [Deltaproteobacteria bacterium]
MLQTALVLAMGSALVAELPKDAMKGYSTLLAETVKDGKVDYAAIESKHKASLDAFLKAVAETTEPTVANEALGLYIDAYNAIVIKSVLNAKMPVQVLKVPGFFDKTTWKVAGKDLTLDALEKTVIKNVAKADPRTHMVLVCGAKGCPVLENKPYSGSDSDKRMDAATKRYVKSAAGARVSDGAVQLSEIFKWYEADFGGAKGVVDFVKKHLGEDAKKLGDAPKVSFLTYDWDLNKP